MEMGWEQLEQPGAAAGAHQPSDHMHLFGTLFAAHPSMSHAELESENGDLGGVCGGIRGT